MIVALSLTGCSKNENEPVLIANPELSVFLANDSIHCFYIDRADDKSYLIKCKRKNYDIIWKKEIVKPNSVIVDLGYGEQAEYEFNNYGIGVDTNSLLYITLWGGEYQNRSGIGVYTHGGDFISNIIFEATKEYTYSRYEGSIRWIDNSIITCYTNSTSNGNKLPCYIITDKNGEKIETKENIELIPTKNPQYCWDRGYIFNRENILYICNMDSGTKEINISDIVKNKYPEEINKPKPKIKSISVKGDIVTILTELTFYNGIQKDINIKINFKTIDIIE